MASMAFAHRNRPAHARRRWCEAWQRVGRACTLAAPDDLRCGLRATPGDVAPRMTAPANELERQIEAAFDYRGHVTVILKNGERVVGYVYNRQFAHPNWCEAPFIEMFLAGSGESRKFSMDVIHAVELTGKDYAGADAASQETRAPDSPKP